MGPNRSCRRARQFAGDFFIGLMVFFAVLALAVLDSRAARSAPVLAGRAGNVVQPVAQSPSNVTAGTLFLRSRNGRDGTSLATATPLGTNVDITVEGPIARTTVTQRFINSGNNLAEGIYAFPLPEDAAVDSLSMRIGKRVVKGQIMSRDDARRIYQAARDAGRNVNQLTPHRPNVFTTAVDNVGPGQEIAVSIEYQETLRGNGNAYSLRFPLAVAARHAPQPALYPVRLDAPNAGADPAPPVRGPAAGESRPVSLQVRLNSGIPLGEVTSPTHEIVLRRTGKNTAVLALARANVPADRDFELTWRPNQTAVPVAAAFQKVIGESAYVLAMLAPPKADAAPVPPAREVIFVIDTSGSMAGTSIAQAKRSLGLALRRLSPNDRFNIIRFDSGWEKLFAEAASVTRESLTIASHFVSRIEARGGSEILPALKAALADTRSKGKRLRQIVMLTDGAIAAEAEFLSYLAAERGRSRLFMVGIGPVRNSVLMRRAAEIGRGSFLHVPADSRLLDRLNTLFERLERPVITDIKLEWGSGLRADVWPNPLPDLYAGEPIVIAAKLSALKGDLTLSGQIAGRPWSRKVDLANARTGAGTGKFWARQRIASLEARRYAGQPASDVDAAIEAVALEHGLASRMTSLVPVDATPGRPPDQPLASEDLPADLPAGWVHDGTFGTGDRGERAAAPRTHARTVTLASKTAPPQPGGARNQRAAPEPDRTLAQEDLSASPAAGAKVALKTVGIVSGRMPGPGAANNNARIWTLTVMALAFAAMMALTLGLWRHLRQSVAPRRGR